MRMEQIILYNQQIINRLTEKVLPEKQPVCVQVYSSASIFAVFYILYLFVVDFIAFSFPLSL